MRLQSLFRGFLLGFGLLCAVPAGAETLEELDALSDVATDETAGIAAARDQAQRGEYLEALATLERVLAVHPQSRDARLIHAIYLCEIDDRRGGLVEIDKLKEKHYGKELLAEARVRCERGAGS
jgi:hypothetical protein